MKPPICVVCGASFDVTAPPGREAGDLVRFADYRPLPHGIAGHPHGLDWFCGRHVEAARRWSGLPEAEALARIR